MCGFVHRSIGLYLFGRPIFVFIEKFLWGWIREDVVGRFWDCTSMHFELPHWSMVFGQFSQSLLYLTNIFPILDLVSQKRESGTPLCEGWEQSDLQALAAQRRKKACRTLRQAFLYVGHYPSCTHMIALRSMTILDGPIKHTQRRFLGVSK